MADSGRTVLVSSHLMSEMQDTADHLIVIGRGRLAADSSMAEFLARSSHNGTVVRSPHAAHLVRLLRHEGAAVDAAPGRSAPDTLLVREWTRRGSASWPGGTDCGCTSWRRSGSRCKRPSWN